ncbi:MAG: cytochrome c3 family protein [Coriobacteriia bacterium]
MSRIKALLTDSAKRPQLLIWIAVSLMVMVLFTVVSVVGTSTNWFCTEPCHNVHYDNTLAFNESSHVMVSCVACHEPLNGSPLDFILMKIEVAPDIVPTVLGTFHLPVNESHLIAYEMPDEQCLQCHNLDNRTVTPSAGLVINHDIHAENEVRCTSCHNRVAHPEDNIELVLSDRRHEDWMVMDACFRCHSLEADAVATGTCGACHPAGFNLVPDTHTAETWYRELGDSSGHAAAYSEEASRVAAAVAWAEELDPAEEIAHEGPGNGGGGLRPGYEQTVNTCYTCHQKQFCTDCHGVEMPHPAEFSTDHGQAGLSNPASCAKCHARTEAEAAGTGFCNACHHPAGSPDRSWLSQHFEPVRTGGAQQCFQCHNPRYCSACHVDGPEAADRVMQEQLGQ